MKGMSVRASPRLGSLNQDSLRVAQQKPPEHQALLHRTPEIVRGDPKGVSLHLHDPAMRGCDAAEDDREADHTLPADQPNLRHLRPARIS
jgi:hypothetical protein